ncbi:ABC transporter permease [Desulfosporosinus metallidurans]|uniref:Putative ABC transporter for tryptophane, permease protein TrpY n=1 Tax=Desulfosporosinus metallidurans TaxID=1888891 RepID=A0A1Q8QV52_9FIRM|nr:ABC transporter permease [Desulfosporosinus metallidurans]OLN31190.1 putative ABC transporter for tryptophane, permease protein TrpY [Desulfosporosinus metallidurans]
MTFMVLQGSFELGIIYAIMALGVFISFRTLNMPDLSVDGSFVLGAAVSAVMSTKGHPFLGLGIAFLAGCGAGSITALLHTKLKIQPLLAGILTMLALYSLNLKVMGGRANIPLMNKATVFSVFEKTALGDYSKLIFSLAVLLLMLLLLFLFLKTRLGFVLRATGDNDHMVRALGVNTDSVILIGLALSNGLVALSGALIAQSQSFVDVGMGIGMVVIGLASVIIGEVVFGTKTLLRRLIAVVLGSILYRLIIAFALEIGMPPTDLKLVSAVIVAIAMAMPIIKKRLSVVKRKLTVTHHERSK